MRQQSPELAALADATEVPRLVGESLGTAYLLWFFVGGLSVHRFYLGFATSAVIQVTLVVLVYVIELTELLLKRNTAAEAAVGALPVMVLPFTLVSFLMPKYTCVCGLRFTPVHEIVAPPVWLATPDTLQLPPPGRP